MRKTIWVAGVFVVLGIIAAVLYFSFFQKKDKTAPEGTFVKIFDTKYDFAKEPEEEVVEWRRSA